MPLTDQQKLGLGLGLGLGIPFFLFVIVPLIIWGIAVAAGVSLLNGAGKDLRKGMTGAMAPSQQQARVGMPNY